MSGAPEAGGLSRPLTENALRASVLLAVVTVMTGCGGGGSAPEGAPPTRPPETAGTATLFPGDEAAQANDVPIDFPRANPGESAKVDVTVTNTKDKPMKEVTAEPKAAPAYEDAPTITDNQCEGQTLAPGESCRFTLLIPPGAADGGFKLEVKTDQGDVTAAVSQRASGELTTTPDGDPGTSEPGTPTTSLLPDTGGTTGHTTGPTGTDPDPDTAPPNNEVPSVIPT